MFKPGIILQERYQLQRRLGRSAPGRQTWLATDLASCSSSSDVIIKLLVFTEMKWSDLRLFEREAQVLKTLDHPKIPCYRNYFPIELHSPSALSWWGLVQDYVPGESLQALLDQNQRFSEAEVCQIAREVLQILEYLHGLCPPVLHRDIKPSNLILDPAQQVWLVDFGGVQDQDAVTGVSFTVIGTVGYAPLEQFWGRAVAASDLYALGATLIHLLTGIAPADLPQRDLRIQFSDRTTADASFVGWLEKLTEPALEHRFTTVNEARQAFEERSSPQLNLVGRINTLRSGSVKSYQRLSPQIVIKQKTNEVLEIAINRFSHRFREISLLYFGLTIYEFLFLSVLGGWGFILGQICIILLLLVHSKKHRFTPPSLLGFIRLDRRGNRFTVKSGYMSRITAGKVSDIRYLSIHPIRIEYTSTSQIYTVWGVTVRATESHTLKWELQEEECIWLVNEIENWLNVGSIKCFASEKNLFERSTFMDR